MKAIISSFFSSMKDQKPRKIDKISVYTLILIVPIAIIVMVTISTPNDLDLSIAQQAKKSISNAMKECVVITIRGKEANPKFSLPTYPSNYKIIPEDRNCSGDDNGAISAISSDDRKYPNLSISMSHPHRKSCSHSGKKDQLHGCSKNLDGTWQ